jgi:hypothetical protein
LGDGLRLAKTSVRRIPVPGADVILLALFAVTLASGAVVGSALRTVRAIESGRSDGERRAHRARIRLWFVLLSPLCVFAAATANAAVAVLDPAYWVTGSVALTVTLAIYIGAACRTLRSKIAESQGDGQTEVPHRWKRWIVPLLPLVFAGIAVIPRNDMQVRRTYSESCILAIVVTMAVSIGIVCQALRSKVAQIKTSDDAERPISWTSWHSLLASMTVAETAMIGACLLIANQAYWTIVDTSSNARLAIVASLITLAAMLGFGIFLVVSLRRTLRTRKLTMRELMAYVAGAAAVIVLPLCTRYKTHVYGDLIEGRYEIDWFSVCLALSTIAVVVFLIRRNSWHQ